MLALLALVMFGLCTQVAMLAPPLSGNDEKAHYSYAVSLYEGVLPTIDTPMADEPDRFPHLSIVVSHQPDQAHRDVWAANHPPLYYVASVPIVAAGEALSTAGRGEFGMRLLDALGMATGLAMAGLLAAELVPGRPVVAVLAPLLLLSCAAVPYDGGLILNDGPALAASTLTLALAVRLIRRGPELPLLVGATLAAAAAATLRAPGLIAAALCALAALIGALRRTDDPRWLPRGIGAAALVGGVPLLASGWFYLRNLDRYGDFGGTGALVAKFDRTGRGGFLDALTNPEFYRAQFRGQWIRLPDMTGDGLLRVPLVVAALAVLGLLVAGGMALRRRDWSGDLGAGVLSWLLVLGYLLIIETSVLTFFEVGGSDHGRYLIPVLPVLGAVLAAGLVGLGELVPIRDRTRRDAVVAVLAAVPMLVVGAILHLRSNHRIAITGYAAGLDHHTIGGGWPWLALGVAVAALLAVLGWLILLAVRGERLPSGHA